MSNVDDAKSWTTPPRVLTVDDEQVVCESIRRVLTEEGYEVATSTSSKAGLDLLRKEPFDLLLLDIKMPEMDGIEMLKAARDISPETEVLIVTGYAGPASGSPASRAPWPGRWSGSTWWT